MLSVTFFSDSESEPANALILSFSVSLIFWDSGYLKNCVSNIMNGMQPQRKSVSFSVCKEAWYCCTFCRTYSYRTSYILFFLADRINTRHSDKYLFLPSTDFSECDSIDIVCPFLVSVQKDGV